MEGKWRKLKNTAFIEELRFEEFNEVIYIISLGKRQLLHINLGFNFDKMHPGKLKFYKEFSAMCEKSGAFRGYYTMFVRCKSYFRELSSLASKIYVFGNSKVFHRRPGDYVGFRDEDGARKVFFTTIFDTTLFIIKNAEGVRFVERYEEEIVKFIEDAKKKFMPAGGPYTYYLLDEDWVVDFLNRYIKYVRENIQPDAVLGADKPTPQGTIHVGLTEIE